jgi:membrane protein CcdC involved in cytochrome C biogenesis
MNRIVVLSIIVWIVLTIWLGGSFGADAVIAMSAILAIGLVITRITLWVRYRRDMRAELAGQHMSE